MKKTRKKALKGFVVGVIITTMFMSTAVGAQVKNTIDVMFNSINITVNGEDQDINNFLYEGTTYVPLRAISEIFNKEVNWDGETKTASVKDIEVGEDKAEIIPLTQDELAYFNGDLFFNGDYINIRNQFLSSLYSQPADIDLFELFYCGSGIAEKITDDELKAVMVKNEIPGSIEDLPCPCEKNSRLNMDKILSEHMGITLVDTNEVRLDHFTYLSQYDSYYHLHGDTNYRTNISFSSGEREGNVVRLFYKDTFFGDGNKVLTLQEENNKYLFVANEKVE
ncbi:MAG TPA: copper amine oxidase N-terminal domain-containing protein [Tissierellaceae bacterium]|nr:copper amine oxidase N-terminal domain-containing protein [Tissierellaceae bacterium]